MCLISLWRRHLSLDCRWLCKCSRKFLPFVVFSNRRKNNVANGNGQEYLFSPSAYNAQRNKSLTWPDVVKREEQEPSNQVFSLQIEWAIIWDWLWKFCVYFEFFHDLSAVKIRLRQKGFFWNIYLLKKLRKLFKWCFILQNNKVQSTFCFSGRRFCSG